MPDRKTTTLNLLSSQTVSAAVSGNWFDVSEYTEGQILFDVTATGGTSPAIDPNVQVSDTNDSSAQAYDHTNVTQITTTGNHITLVTNIGKYLRINIPAPSGTDTPTMTLSVTGVLKT